MIKSLAVATAAAVLLASLPSGAGADEGELRSPFTPGAPGIGDPYYPLDGNGGYDARHYDLDVSYDPDTDVLRGVATIAARATQNLSSFNLDLVGLNVRWIKVNGVRASFTRDGGELTVVPKRGLPKHQPFTVVIAYDGSPEPVVDVLGISGFLHTDDGTLVAGQPRVAATWYPVNDHPLDTASYSFEITVPEGLEAMANGVLTGTSTRHGRTTWKWFAREPMASYLTTMTVGQFDVRSYRQDGIKYWDAVDPDLYAPVAQPTDDAFAWSDKVVDETPSFKRLMRTIDVPAAGGALTFAVTRDTEFFWDFFFVEAHTAGSDDWTTLPDANGATSDLTGASCAYWPVDHPFVEHYQTLPADPFGECTSTGTTGSWNAATGASDGAEQWSIDLTAYAGTQIELSFTYMSDLTIQGNGVFIDDVVVPGGAGSTGFEDDGDQFDGWTVAGSPAGSVPNSNDWFAATVADLPDPIGVTIDGSLDRQPEIIDFLAGYFGKYPFSAAGGIVDDYDGLGFALENQTRPIYAYQFFGDSIGGDAVVVHEYAHQWFGDNLPLGAWQDIWLNEGFATYAEWLWSEHEGLGTPDEIFGFYAAVIPADDPFWALPIGDPGPDALFDFPVYARGAMTLHALRQQVGDDHFFKIVKTWARVKAGQNVSTPQFIALAERISGQQLDELFELWLYTAASPFPPAAPVAAETRTAAVRSGPAIALRQMQRWGVAQR